MEREEALDVLRKNIPTDKSLPVYEALQTLVPELSESEDERIRKAIIELLKEVGRDDTGISENAKCMIAYLEKQKEHQETCTKFLAKILKHSAEGFRNVLKKKGIDYIPHESFWTNTAGSFSKQECNEFYKWMDDMTMELVTEETPEYKKGFKDGLDASKKEQKPVDYDHEMWKNCEANFEGGKKEVIEHPEKYGLTKQKPADLSKMLVHKEPYIAPVPTPMVADEQKPTSISCGHENDAEWGQEDKEKIVTISEIIEHCTTIPYSGGTLTLNKEYKKELLCLIRTLRPSWKPSEEQMEALEECGECKRCIKELYEQLKKL